MKHKYPYFGYPVKQKKIRNRRIILTLLIIIAILILVSFIGLLTSSRHKSASTKALIINQEASYQIAPNISQAPPTELTTTFETSDTTPTAVNWQHIIVQPGDSLAKIFQRLHLSQKALLEIIQLNDQTSHLTKLIPGEEISILVDEENRLKQLSYPLNVSEVLIVEGKKAGGFKTTIKEKQLDARVVFASGVIEHSLYVTAKKIGLPEKIIHQLTSFFSWHLNFATQLRPSDQFSLMYSELYDANNRVAVGDILVAKLYNKAQTHTIIQYTDSLGKTDYYLPNGDNNRKAFLRFPVKFSHISSSFNLYRKHPILGEIRPHRGIDLAAPLGTPIKATADGTISFIGNNGGYGRMIKIQHEGQYVTLYAHLLRFNKELILGSRVVQGEVIGYVGQSGLATGPHVHYEIHIAGKPVNPISVNLPQAQPLEGLEFKRFSVLAEDLLTQLQHHEEIDNISKDNQTTFNLN